MPDKKVIKVWTIQMGSWRLAVERKIIMLDVTAKSGNSAFAPDYSAVMDYKNGKMTEEQYTTLYLTRMRQSFKQAFLEWEKLKEYTEVAIACYCKPNTFCHRYIFVDLMKKYLEREGFVVQLCGEITNG